MSIVVGGDNGTPRPNKPIYSLLKCWLSKLIATLMVELENGKKISMCLMVNGYILLHFEHFFFIYD